MGDIGVPRQAPAVLLLAVMGSAGAAVAHRKENRPYEDPRAGTATLSFDGDIVFDNGHFRKTADAESR